jgi:hypothetical protein
MSEPHPLEGLSIGDLIDNLREIRAERRAISKRDSELVKEWDEAKGRLIFLIEQQGMKKASSALATATITEEEVPIVDDWDTLWDHIRRTGDLYLLQRRVATAAWREHLHAGTPIPGTSSYHKKDISLREL